MSKKVTLTFTRDNLLYDIGNYCYVEGDIMKVEDENRRHQVIDVTQSGNVDRVTRILDLTYAICVELLYPYTKIGVDNLTNLVDNLDDRKTYIIGMEVPDTFSKTTHELLLRLIHEFMVYRVLHDWLSITDVEAAQKWYDKAEEIADRIKNSMNHGSGKRRLRQSPF